MSLKEIKQIGKWHENTATSAPQKKLSSIATKSISSFRKSSNEMEKQSQILAKGHNETYKNFIPMEYADS
jgi:hypothetical protein